MRVGVIDVFGQDYIRTARAKGLGEGKVVMKHALRNSLLPIINFPKTNRTNYTIRQSRLQ